MPVCLNAELVSGYGVRGFSIRTVFGILHTGWGLNSA